MLTIFLALGAWRISRSRVLTRRMPAIETLGAATVLCVDKTGTLTLNQMSVQQALRRRRARSTSRCAAPRRCPRSSTSCSSSASWPASATRSTRWRRRCRRLGERLPGRHRAPARRLDAGARVPAVAASCWRCRTSGSRRTATSCVDRGQGRARGDRRPVPPDRRTQRQALAEQVRGHGRRRAAGARRGARRSSGAGGLPPRTSTTSTSSSSGLVGLADPVRPTVPAAIQECYAAGIRVVMITGDYPGTAQSIARQIGLTNPDDGHHRARAGRDERRGTGASASASVNVFARVVPGAEAAHRQRAEGQRRDRGHDRRRRQRRAGAEGRAHRHRHGRARHGRGPRGRGPGPARRRLLLHRRRPSGWAAASSTTSRRRSPTSSPSTCRSPGCRCIPVFFARLAAASCCRSTSSSWS